MMLKLLIQCRTFVERIRGSYGNAEKGVTTVEYAVMLALVALAVALAAPNIRDGVVNIFNATATELTTINPAP